MTTSQNKVFLGILFAILVAGLIIFLSNNVRQMPVPIITPEPTKDTMKKFEDYQAVCVNDEGIKIPCKG